MNSGDRRLSLRERAPFRGAKGDTKSVRTTRRAVVSLAAFLASMLGLQAALAHWLAAPQCQALEAKWRDFERRADEYSIVFIGTSHVERHVNPRVVDQALAAKGYDTRSYNLGLPKMSMLEAAMLIERLVQRRPRRLQLVVVEPTLYLYDTDNWATDRAMAEHDWASTGTAIGMAWNSERRRGTGVWGRLVAVWPHALSLICRSLGLRRGHSLFATSSDLAVAINESAGFSPLPVEPDWPSGERPAWQRRFSRFSEIEPDWSGPGLTSQEIAYFDRQLERICAIPAQAVWLLGPKVKRDSHTAAVLRTHGERYAGVPLLDYLRGRGDGELYRLHYWHDFDHLNAHGANVFSRQLSDRLALLLKR